MSSFSAHRADDGFGYVAACVMMTVLLAFRAAERVWDIRVDPDFFIANCDVAGEIGGFKCEDDGV